MTIVIAILLSPCAIAFLKSEILGAPPDNQVCPPTQNLLLPPPIRA
jgi:hypothetical protein